MSYWQVVDHRRMLFDQTRNAAYARAIRQCVTDESVVLDLGAGLGLHGLIAAEAGARMVYLVEPEAVVSAAVEAARASGLADRVTVLRGRIEDVILPEKVDLIISALTGNLLFSEDLLPALYYARDRFLKDGGRLIPDVAQLWLAPWESQALHAEHVAQWQRPVMGFDFSFAAHCAANSIIWPSAEELAGARSLSPGACAVELDLTASSTVDCAAGADALVEGDGVCHGLLAWLRLRVGEGWLSAHPLDSRIHWSPAMLPLDPPLPLREGQRVKIELHRPFAGDWTWSARVDDAARRHSTFLSQPHTASDLERMAPDGVVQLGPQGTRAWEIMGLMRANWSNRHIAHEIAARHGMTQERALLEVRTLAMRYGKTF
jgi:SAM-dependent methyltransferase